MCWGLEHLHTRSIVHLDIKPENIVITEAGGRDIKIVDLGSAVTLVRAGGYFAMNEWNEWMK